METKRANEALPPHLLAAIQQYADGCYIYIPKQAERARWGQNNGTRQELSERNISVRRERGQGASVDTLADRYCLSVESIKRIIYTKK